MHRTPLLLLLSSLALAPGCPSAAKPPGTDAASGPDGGRDAAFAGDTGSTDDAASTADTGTTDDAGTDAAITDDAGIDCSTIGCGAPPICGTACDAPCGCCPCAEGSEMGTYVCQGGCWAPRGTGASGDTCTVTSDCGSGLSCCYPCGIPGCTNRCTPTCAAGDPGCVGGCLAVP